MDVFLGVWAFEHGVDKGDVGRAFCRRVLVGWSLVCGSLIL